MIIGVAEAITTCFHCSLVSPEGQTEEREKITKSELREWIEKKCEKYSLREIRPLRRNQIDVVRFKCFN